jgi:hypothetical protein
VITYAVFMLLGQIEYRRIEDLHLPLRHVVSCTLVGLGLTAVTLAVVPAGAGLPVHILAAGVAWSAAAAGVLLGPARGLIERDSPLWTVFAAARRKPQE